MMHGARWLPVLLVACTDPRARPVTPAIQVQVSPTLAVVSPGTLPHSVYAFDADGLGPVRVHVGTPDSALSADSTRLPPGAFESTLSYVWDVPAGIAAGTAIRIVATVTDLSGLVAADTAFVQVNADPRRQGAKRPEN